MDVQRYLERIDYRGAVAADLDTLGKLQQAHMRTVPFENLSIHYRQPIVLEHDALYRKIVERRRGGFCYELNTLFAWLLREIGFRVTLLSAGVATADGGFGPEFDHLALRVDLDHAYLVDVGFGDSFQQPLRLDGGEQRQGAASYRIDAEDGTHFLKKGDARGADAALQAQYRFTLQPRALGDFEEMCRHHQTSPASHFTQKRICSRATADGRISLSDLRLIITRGGEREESMLGSEEEFRQALKNHFAIDL
ncbi:MAG TPA: arylamine N-acetyltransferase [Paucimonas sp.]|nr:arylamine N-acetyltransferase [Paucimonas sp.]